MDNFIILIFSGVVLLTVASIIVLRTHYRKVIKTKDHGIVQHIRQQYRLEKELTYINVEKKVMEKMLETKFDAVALVTHLPKSNTKTTKRDTPIANCEQDTKRDAPIANRRERKNH